MCDEFINQGLVEDKGITRRAFGLIAAAAAGAASAGVPAGSVEEKDVRITTPDGISDAVLFAPVTAGKFPGVLMWPDIMGLRPTFRAMGRRLAADGYVVLVPNPFYRSKRAPVIEGPIDFNDPATRQLLLGYRKAMSDQGIIRDARAYVAFLDAQAKTNKRHPAGVQGYCMGGTLAFMTAAAAPDRIGAIASFHGGNGLVTKDLDSPHLLVGRTNPDASFLVLQAKNDDAQQPQVKDELKAAFAAAHRRAIVDVYPANHGWCVPGGQVYDQAQAERAWSALLQLYRVALA
ncbi:MAG TPA: dienelactone hydrolase family protein [Sphingomicrobium sp.]|nr:dienelactone hydrolase family protein [Sphingomicrobium sp.]